MKNILLLSNDALLSRLFLTGTKKFNLQTIISSDLEQALNTIRKGDCSAIVINIPVLAERCPKKIVRQIQETNPYLPVYVLMDQMDISEAISLTKMGVEYCYSRPFALEQIIENIDKTLQNLPAASHSGIKKIATESYREQSNRPKYIYAKSQQAKELYDQIDKVADTNFKVVIYGETGTGKESVARRLCKGKIQE
ncbi:MAG: sigma 54-interacting transcriptional regulator [Taibaiella sp.]|nr:sigma 54-interacting transcriptional regulator [Taibaiella sp.]